jgi:hypothetical protein
MTDRSSRKIDDLPASEGALSPEEAGAVQGGGAVDGISYLVAVTQMKANNANEGAIEGSPPKTPPPPPPPPKLPRPR